MKPRLVFLASGRGSNFEALVTAIGAGTIHAEATALICNRENAPALDRAAKLGVPSILIASKYFKNAHGQWDKAAYEQELMRTLERLKPAWIVLAGYMLLLGPSIVARWPNRIINIHPSLLPAFPGLNAVRQALEAGVTQTGCTVHLVTNEMDAGPILAQSTVKIEPGDTEQTLSARLLPVEHRTYIQALVKLLPSLAQ